MKLKFIAAAFLAATAFSASAADQSVPASAAAINYFTGTSTLLDGNDDLITFTGLAAGTYTAVLSYSGVNVNITAATLNGKSPLTITSGNTFSFGGFSITDNSPFVLQLWGTVTKAGDLGYIPGLSPGYSGQLTVTAVPEPETYAMLLGGLALVGVAARRRKNSV